MFCVNVAHVATGGPMSPLTDQPGRLLYKLTPQLSRILFRHVEGVKDCINMDENAWPGERRTSCSYDWCLLAWMRPLGGMWSPPLGSRGSGGIFSDCEVKQFSKSFSVVPLWKNDIRPFAVKKLEIAACLWQQASKLVSNQSCNSKAMRE